MKKNETQAEEKWGQARAPNASTLRWEICLIDRALTNSSYQFSDRPAPVGRTPLDTGVGCQAASARLFAAAPFGR